MVTASATGEAGRHAPALGGSLAFLLLSLPLGAVTFALLVGLVPAGLSTAVVWVGVPILASVVLSARGAARMERARVYALLDTYIDLPYLPLPAGSQSARWKVRLKDPSTWRDLAYLFLLFPLGLFEFVLVTVFWATSLGLVALPIFYRFLPDGAYFFPSYDLRWITVDSTVAALPWAALGVLFVALSVALTKALASLHAKYAVALLGPTMAQRHRMEKAWNEVEAMNTVTG
ncbi:sensor domain-containing protein [Amycolatopsis sp. NPDC059021]|uniref:sensor domain-containing protein n=1 Tax=Amycolatopsis sp. NPDC059021 TaxID=3346704 RepID=UPI003671A9CB